MLHDSRISNYYSLGLYLLYHNRTQHFYEYKLVCSEHDKFKKKYFPQRNSHELKCISLQTVKEHRDNVLFEVCINYLM